MGLVFVCVYLRSTCVSTSWVGSAVGRPFCVCAALAPLRRIGGRRRYPQDTAVSSGCHRYPEDTVSPGHHWYPQDTAVSPAPGYRRYPQDTVSQDTAVSWGHRILRTPPRVLGHGVPRILPPVLGISRYPQDRGCPPCPTTPTCVFRRVCASESEKLPCVGRGTSCILE